MRVFALAEETGNVRSACKAMGIHPSTFLTLGYFEQELGLEPAFVNPLSGGLSGSTRIDGSSSRPSRTNARGIPKQILTDNGKVFTGRLGRRPASVLFDRICFNNGVRHLLTAPYSPTTTGRSQRT